MESFANGNGGSQDNGPGPLMLGDDGQPLNPQHWWLYQ